FEHRVSSSRRSSVPSSPEWTSLQARTGMRCASKRIIVQEKSFWSLNEPPRRCELIVIRRYSPPCTTARRGGCVIKENLAKPPKQTQPGWFSFLDSSENHPGLAISGCFAIFSESLGHPSLQ